MRIEREVDIRKRILNVYNKTEEDFESLKEYNEYLEEIESIIFKLVEGVDVEETQKQIDQYENDHKIEILEIAMRESQKDADTAKYQEAVEWLRQEKLKIQRQMESEDVEFQQQQKAELMEKLSASNADAEEIMTEQKSKQQKRTNQRKRKLQQISKQLDQQFLAQSITAVEEKNGAPKTPFTPFVGDRDVLDHYKFIGRKDEADTSDTYVDPYVTKLAQNKEYLGGGWRLEHVYERALEEAFMGLTCFVAEEKANAKGAEVLEAIDVQ